MPVELRHPPISVFTKPWPTMPLPQLAAMVRKLGFEGVELPVRAGFQVHPANIATKLQEAARVLTNEGLTIFSIAGPIDEPTIAACANAGVKVIRICLGIDPAKGYRECIGAFQRKCELLMPALRRSGVTIGLQNHHGNDIGSAIGLIHAIEPLDPRHVSAVLDLAHCALAGEPEELAIDIAWPRLCMVNLKNGYRRRIDDAIHGESQWKVSWVGAKEGFASWSRTIHALRARGYDGPLCLTAEYSNPARTNETIAADLAYARALLNGAPGN